MGLNSVMQVCIGPTTRKATVSDSAMLRRLGIKSAKTMKSEVMMKNDARKPSVAAVLEANQSSNTRVK
ncbi:hypothetical protein D3C85_1765550 [compost metagenome]